jgi:hypothetical protein
MTVDEAIRAYTERFGGFPAFLFMGASDDVIIDAVKKAVSTGEEIEAEANNDY